MPPRPRKPSAPDARSIARIVDPRRRLAAATSALDKLREHQDEISQLRAETMVELTGQGASLRAIGEIAGITRARVAQILDAHRPRRRR